MSTPIVPRIKYINNKELLSAIHECKLSYCSYEKKEHAYYDMIIESVDVLTPEFLELARIKKASSLSTKAAVVSPDSIPLESLVFRIMGYDHIPPDPERKRKGRRGDGYQKTPFPPFRHVIVENGKVVEVLRSHWTGDFKTGEFTPEKGRINNRLGEMIMLLVDRFSRRANFRNYCVDTETEALTQRGWLGINEINENDKILSYENGSLKWSKIKSIYRGHYEGDMFKLTVRGLDALVTPRHKFICDDGLKPIELFRETDRMILTGKAVDGAIAEKYSDSFVELVGWAITEGCRTIKQRKNGVYVGYVIHQNEGDYSNRIQKCLDELGEKYSKYSREQNDKNLICFSLRKNISTQIESIAPNKVLSMDFILSLSDRQRNILIETMIDADGWRHENRKRYCQKDKAHIDAFMSLCVMSGYRMSCKKRDIGYVLNFFSKNFDVAKFENIDLHGGKPGRNGKHKVDNLNKPTIPYNDMVWCPETEYGSFMARRNGTVYLSGNTYVDEMRSHAMLQLSQIGLQFDESKSDNPFAFYTTAIKNCFLRVLHMEKRCQDIRDDILIMNNQSPSYTRQVANEIEQIAIRDMDETTFQESVITKPVKKSK